MKTENLNQLVTYLETIDPLLNVNHLRFLTYIYMQYEETNAPVPMSKAIADTGCTKAAVSRLCAYFGTRKANTGLPGLQLLERVPDPIDTRTKHIAVTGRGKALLNVIKGA